MRPPAFLRRLGARTPESFTIALRPTLIFERAPVTAQGAEVTAPGLGAEPDVPTDHAREVARV